MVNETEYAIDGVRVWFPAGTNVLALIKYVCISSFVCLLVHLSIHKPISIRLCRKIASTMIFTKGTDFIAVGTAKVMVPHSRETLQNSIN